MVADLGRIQLPIIGEGFLKAKHSLKDDQEKESQVKQKDAWDGFKGNCLKALRQPDLNHRVTFLEVTFFFFLRYLIV